MAFCTKCGGQMPDGATFCTGCGSPMNGGRAPQGMPMNNMGQQRMPMNNMAPQGMPMNNMMPNGMPMYQRPPVNYGMMMKQNAKLFKLLLVISNAILVLGWFLPYYSYGGHGANLTVDASYGIAVLCLALSALTIPMVYGLKNKLMTTSTAGFNCLMTLLAIINIDKEVPHNGAGHVFVIIGFFCLLVTAVLYFLSTDDK